MNQNGGVSQRGELQNGADGMQTLGIDGPEECAQIADPNQPQEKRGALRRGTALVAVQPQEQD